MTDAPLSPAIPEASAEEPWWRRALHFGLRFSRHVGAAMGLVILVVLIVAAIFAPQIAPFDPVQIDTGPRLGAPSAQNLFGNDLHGRDIFSRIAWGGRYSLAVGIATVAFALIFGSAIGIFIGHVGGRTDAVGSRIIDVALGFPSVVLAILVVVVLGVGLVNVVVAVGISQVPHFARVARAAVLATKEQLFIDSARAIGASGWIIMTRHLLPNVVPVLIVLGTLNLGDAILATATLGFLGLGAQPPTPEWGAMLNDGREYMRYAPWIMIFPGLALFLAVMAVNLMGDRLSQMLDPKLRPR